MLRGLRDGTLGRCENEATYGDDAAFWVYFHLSPRER